MPSKSDIFDANILIVDDQQTNVQLLEHVLRSVGYRHLTSSMDPRAVCSLHRANHYDLILLDLEMPGMDGFAVMQCLKEVEPNGYAPILVVTAQPDHKLRALAAGAKDFLSKPFDLSEIRSRVHNMLKVRLLYRQLEQTNRSLESLALHDTLTGLPNRRLLMDRMGQAILTSARRRAHCALMFLDLDNLKHINDTLGHDTGDMLLQQVGERLQAAVRESDSVARLGGDEFVVLLEALSSDEHEAIKQTQRIANKILDTFRCAFSLGDHRCESTASIGIAVFMGNNQKRDELLRMADSAMYQAKSAGRNRAHFFDAHQIEVDRPHVPSVAEHTSSLAYVRQRTESSQGEP